MTSCYCPQVWEWAHPRFGRVADSAAIVMTIAYNFLAHCVVVASIVHLDLPSIPSVVIALEQVRYHSNMHRLHRNIVFAASFLSQELLIYS